MEKNQEKELIKNNKIKDIFKNLSTRNKQLIIFIIIMLIVILGVIYIKVFYKTSIDLSKYIEVTYSGFNGYATATVTTNEDLINLFDNENIYNKFLEYLELEVENNDNLSNGDTLKINISITNEEWLSDKKLRLSKDEISFTVDGLDEGTVFDIFDGLEIGTDGYSPYVTIALDNKYVDHYTGEVISEEYENYRRVSYSTDFYNSLKNGDVITIKASYPEDEFEELGLIVVEDTMEYVIEGQDFYVESVNDLNEESINNLQEGAFNTLNTYMEERIEQSTVASIFGMWYNLDSLDSFDDLNTSIELVNMYLLSKETTTDVKNYIYSFYKVTLTDTANNTSVEYYFGVYTTDVVVNEDGDLITDEEIQFTRYPSSYETLDDLYTKTVANKELVYNVETIL